MSPSVRDWVPEGHLVWTVLDVGLASVGVVSIDGPKMSANASMNANRDFVQIARAILREAAEIDEREDELYGC